jgi:hypothetical protein
MHQKRSSFRMRWATTALMIAASVAMFAWSRIATPSASHIVKANAVRRAYGDLPLSFEANRGQVDARVKFLARGSGYTMFLTSSEAVLKVRAPSKKYSVLRIHLDHANSNPQVTGVDRLPGASNYFIGSDRERWRTNIPTFAAVRFREVYAGIDLVYRGTRGRLEYDLEVAAGADPEKIALTIDGARSLAIDARGNLIVRTSTGDIVENAPLVYQSIGGHRRIVSGGYVVRRNRQVTFKLGVYDKRQPIVIDPLLTYSSYLGGTGGDEGVGIAVDAAGAAWITGNADSADFPVTADAMQPATFGNGDIFITKVSPDGTALIYSTYAGGSGVDQATGIALDPLGNAYVSGLTQSANYPVSAGAFQSNLGGDQSAFVTALDQSGGLIYSTYVGADSSAVGIAVDSSGDAYIAGDTTSESFPTTAGVFQPEFISAMNNAFVAQLNPSGTGLIYSTFLGTTNGGWPAAIALDSARNIYVSGGSASGANYDGSGCVTRVCGAIVKLGSGASSLLYSDVFEDAVLLGLAVDGAGNAHLVGFQDGPVLLNLGQTGQVATVPITVGGQPSQIAVAPTSGDLVIAGSTEDGLATTEGAFQSTYGGSGDAFITIMDPTGASTLYTTYLGGSGLELAHGVATDSSGNAYVTGSTLSDDFPVTPGVFQFDRPAGSNESAFVTRIVPVLLAPTPTATASPISTVMVPPTMTPVRSPLPTRTPGPTTVATPSSTVTMTPTATVTVTATMTPTATAAPTPIVLLKMLPVRMNFHRVQVGKTTAPKSIAVLNPKRNKSAVMITGVALASQKSGTPSGFAIDLAKSSCVAGGSLARGKKCRVAITFTPMSGGAKTDSVVITGNVSNSGAPVSLEGVGK